MRNLGPKDHSHVPSTTPHAEKETNAQRLRENQRRSRQRKKEYLASLESRYRDCQRAGIEASVEVQNAAKRVVRENQVLRELLRAKGISNTEVDVWVRERTASGDESSSPDPVEDALKALAKRPCSIESGSVADIGRRKSTGMVNERRQYESSNQDVGIAETTGQLPVPRNFQHIEESRPTSVASQSPPSSQLPTPNPQSPSVLPLNSSYSVSSPRSSNQPSPMTFTDLPPHPPATYPNASLYIGHIQHQLPSQDGFAFRSPQFSSPDHNPSSPQMYENYMAHQHYIASGSHNIHGSMACDVARTMIEDIHQPEGIEGLTRQICPLGISQGCVVDTNHLFTVMDRNM